MSWKTLFKRFIHSTHILYLFPRYCFPFRLLSSRYVVLFHARSQKLEIFICLPICLHGYINFCRFFFPSLRFLDTFTSIFTFLNPPAEKYFCVAFQGRVSLCMFSIATRLRVYKKKLDSGSFFFFCRNTFHWLNPYKYFQVRKQSGYTDGRLTIFISVRRVSELYYITPWGGS